MEKCWSLSFQFKRKSNIELMFKNYLVIWKRTWLGTFGESLRLELFIIDSNRTTYSIRNHCAKYCLRRMVNLYENRNSVGLKNLNLILNFVHYIRKSKHLNANHFQFHLVLPVLIFRSGHQNHRLYIWF